MTLLYMRDLLESDPSTEYEHFVRQLFEASGLEGWTTKRTGDDGVDAVVTNPDPMIGGLTSDVSLVCSKMSVQAENMNS